MICDSCKDRGHCIELCPRAEEFVNQDYVYRREVLASDIGLDLDAVTSEIETIDLPSIKNWILLDKTDLTTLQKRYLFLNIWKGKSYAEIGRAYNTSRHNIRSIVSRAKNR